MTGRPTARRAAADARIVTCRRHRAALDDGLAQAPSHLTNVGTTGGIDGTRSATCDVVHLGIEPPMGNTGASASPATW